MPTSEPTPTDPVPAPVPPQAATQPTVDDLPVARPIANARDYEHVYDDDEGDFNFVDDVRNRQPRRIAMYVRVLLAVMAVGFTAIIIVALCLNPYQGDGEAMKMETHTQLGLPKCSSVQMFGRPCPACGMTTSFALLTHGDLVNSMKANWVGTLMCATIIVLTPWLLASAYRGRLLWVRNGELFATIVLAGLLLLMMGRWSWIMFVP